MRAKLTNRRRCKARTHTGRPCGMPPLDGKETCYNHSPEHGQARARSRKRGGQERRTPRLFATPDGPTPLRDLASVRAVLEQVVSETLLQPNGYQRSRTIAALLNVALKILEVGELEARLAALEEKLFRTPRRIT